MNYHVALELDILKVLTLLEYDKCIYKDNSVECVSAFWFQSPIRL